MLSEDLLLLKIIDAGASIDLLVKRGFSYSQIVMKIESQIEAGTVTFDKKRKIQLTKAGKEMMKESFQKANYSEKETWILPQEHYYCPSIGESVIILPKKI